MRIETFTRDGLTFDVLDDGPVDGEVIVLLHGFPQRASSWDKIAPLLQAQGYRTLAPDQRGYSPGARPRRRRDYRNTELADDVAALIDRVGGRAHVVGHDWGSIAAWSAAQAHPDRVRTLTALSVPNPQAFVSSLVTSRQLLKSWYMFLFQVPSVPERLARRRGSPFDVSLRRSGLTDEEVAGIRRHVVDYGAIPGGLGWYRGLPFGDRALARRHVTVPTTMVWSDGDRFVGRAGVDRTERYVDAPYRLVTLEGVSHWLLDHAPEACAEAILERVASTS